MNNTHFLMVPFISICGVDGMPWREDLFRVTWRVEYTDKFGTCWDTLGGDERIRITASVDLLERRGPNLPFPHSSGINGARRSHIRELRVQAGGRPLRVFHAFDPRRTAILLIGGDNTGQDGFYLRLIPEADRLYDEPLAEIAAKEPGKHNDGG